MRARSYLPAALDRRCAAVGLISVVDGLVLNWTLNRALLLLDSYGPAVVNTYLAGLHAGGRGQHAPHFIAG